MNVKWMPLGMLQANCTIISDPESKEAIAFDVGGDADKVLKYLKKEGLALVRIILTHMHFDHLLGVMELADATKAEVWAPKLDEELGASVPFQMGLFSLRPPANFKPVEVNHWFADGQEIELGGAVVGKVLHTPGHTPGSCCFYFKDDALLISGDTLFNYGIGRSDLPGGSADTLLKSIKNKLMVLPGNTRVITGHGSETTIADEKSGNPYVSGGGMFSL